MKINLVVLGIVLFFWGYGHAQEIVNWEQAFAQGVPLKLNANGVSDLSLPESFCTDKEINSQFWHVQDLNGDGLNDLIYSGPCKPYFQTQLFFNTGKGWHKKIDQAGSLLQLTSTDEGIWLVIKRFAIGCDTENVVDVILIKGDEVISKRSLIYHYTTILAGTNFSEETKTVSGMLRYTPEVNDTDHENVCTGFIEKGNQIKAIENKQVEVLKKEGDWLLVSCPFDNYERVGWIKAE